MKLTARILGKLTQLRRSQNGSAMIELAVALPLLVFIAIGVMDYGRVYFTSIAVANSARAGAEWGAQNGATSVDQTNIQNFARLDGAEASPIVFTSSTIFKCGNTVVSNSDTCAGYGPPRVYVQVTASKTVTLLIRYPGLPTSVSIARTATFRLQ